MNGRSIWRRLAAVSAAALALALVSQAQPVINPPTGTPPGLQAVSPHGNVAAITSGVNIPSGFTLLINGSFQPGILQNVTWVNTITTQSQSFGIGNGITGVSASQISVLIPPSLFFSVVATPQPVTIAVNETGFPAATATFTINPPLGSASSTGVLTPGTVGVSYSQPMASGGTPPYVITLDPASNPLPPGLPLTPGSLILSGTPTTAGTYNWTLQLSDTWDSSTVFTAGTEIVNVPGQTGLSPAIIPAGSPDTLLTFNGSNFVPIDFVVDSAVPGTLLQFTPPLTATTIPLVTNFINASQLTATVAQGLLLVPGNATVAALQPSGAVTAGLPLVVAAPSILSLNFPVVTVRNTPVTLVVNGANFVANSGESPTASTVLLGGRVVSTSLLSGTALSTTQTFNTPGVISVQVVNPGGIAQSNIVNLTVAPAPTLSGLAPSAGYVGSNLTLTVTGANFSSTMRIVVAGQPLATTFVSATTLTAVVPAGVIGNVSAVPVTVVTADNFSPSSLSLPVLPALRILTSTLPPGASGGAPYSAQVTATGGLPPYSWSATGLATLSINRSTGAISGALSTPLDVLPVTVTVTDANGVNATASFTIAVTQPPLQIITPNTLPPGTVGIAYVAVISSGGGRGTFNYSLAGGSLPPGLALLPGGAINGTPSTPGTFPFTVQVSDGTSTASADFSILIKPAALTVTGPASIPSVAAGSAVAVKFGATGGVPPYVFSSSGSLPGGTSLSRDGALSGTASAPGSFNFTILVVDSQGTQASKSFSITITSGQLTIVGSLGDGQVGVAYSGRVIASGGKPPYTLTLSGLPGGLTFDGSIVSGTPTLAGTYTVTANATDAAGAQVSQTFTINITAGALTITGSLGEGFTGVPYTASLSASGGAAPYTFSFNGLPAGLTGTSAGAVSGTPTTVGSFAVKATVTDAKGLTGIAIFNVAIAVQPLTITAASVPNTTAGAAVSATFTASGGTPPYTWSAGGLPAGLSLSPGGVLSGSAAAPGTPSFSVTVKDSAGASATKTVNLNIALPSAPAVNLTGLPATSNPATQSTLQIGLGGAYPVDVTVTLTLTFAADSGPDDPTVQFAAGGRTVTLTIPAGAVAALTSVGLQTGTVAGLVTITARLAAAAQDITPTPVPARTVRINAAAPAATSVTATISGSGFTVTVVGYSTTRSVTSAIFTFTAAAGANLQTTTITIPSDQLFQTWYQSAASAAFGSQFTFTQPFNVQGGVSSIASVTVTLVNSVGSSTPVSATLR